MTKAFIILALVLALSIAQEAVNVTENSNGTVTVATETPKDGETKTVTIVDKDGNTMMPDNSVAIKNWEGKNLDWNTLAIKFPESFTIVEILQAFWPQVATAISTQKVEYNPETVIITIPESGELAQATITTHDNTGAVIETINLSSIPVQVTVPETETNTQVITIGENSWTATTDNLTSSTVIKQTPIVTVVAGAESENTTVITNTTIINNRTNITCHSSCGNCSGPSANNCTSCRNNSFTFSNNTCFVCHPSCRTCRGPNANQCLTCAVSSIIANNGSCTACDVNCLTCDSMNGARCSSCQPNFALTTLSQCCPSNCATCSGTTCSICSEGFNLQDGRCTPSGALSLATSGFFAFLMSVIVLAMF